MAQTPRPADGIRVGDVFLDKYRIEGVIGTGGMGVVAECTHLGLNERVAVKMLREDVLRDPDAVERFMREAQAAVKLKSEYVARVRDVGTMENGTPFMVMEYLEGHDLGQLLEQQHHLAVPWACELVLQTCEALAEAHSLGIVHRDVKPTNLFVTWRPDGTSLIKVLDFGISKVTMGADMQLTQTQSLLGTPAYMSPEQMRSARNVDARTDIWSLGTVLYELFEGRKPFEAESFSEMCVKVAVDAPTPMENAPLELQDVVLRCLAKSPEQRYQTMAELAHDLAPFSQDPYNASVLVERMQRMLRRSQGDWEGLSTGVGRNGVPPHVRDVGSQPVRLPKTPSPAAADPRLRTPVPSARAVPAPTLHEPSAPARAPSELLTIRQPTKRTGWVVLLLALVGAGGVALAMGLGAFEADKTTTTTATMPHATEAAQPATPPTTGTPTTATATAKPDDTTRDATTATAKPEVGTPVGGTAIAPTTGTPTTGTPTTDTPTTDTPTTDTPTTDKVTRGKAGMKKAGKATKLATGGKVVPKEAGKLPKETVKPPPDAPKQPKCDPFSSRVVCK